MASHSCILVDSNNLKEVEWDISVQIDSGDIRTFFPEATGNGLQLGKRAIPIKGPTTLEEGGKYVVPVPQAVLAEKYKKELDEEREARKRERAEFDQQLSITSNKSRSNPSLARKHKGLTYCRDDGRCVLSNELLWSCDLYFAGLARADLKKSVTEHYKKKLKDITDPEIPPHLKSINSHIVPVAQFGKDTSTTMKEVLAEVMGYDDVKTTILLAEPWDYLFNWYYFTVNPDDGVTVEIRCKFLEDEIKKKRIPFPSPKLRKSNFDWPPKACWNYHYKMAQKAHIECTGCSTNLAGFIKKYFSETK